MLLCPIVHRVICPEAEPVAPRGGRGLLAREGQGSARAQGRAHGLQVGSVHPGADLQRGKGAKGGRGWEDQAC